MPAEPYLSIGDFAARINVARATIEAYNRDGRLPAPDVIIGLAGRKTRGWAVDTIDAWQAARPGQGARTDIRHSQ